MSGNHEKKVVVITGASAGVGRATACAFAERNYRVVLLARGSEGLEAAKKDVEQRGAEALAIPIDVADYQQVEQAAEQAETTFGPIAVWVNNAMTTVFSSFGQIGADEYRRVSEVVYLGFVHGTMAALKRMRPRNHGTIVQVGSALAYRSIPLQSAYCGGKAAIRGFTDSIRCELLHEHSKVHITMVQMPALNTPQFLWCKNRMPEKGQPVPPIFQPEVAARAIVWSACHRRRELNVGLSSTLAVWSAKLFPGLGDHYLARNGFKAQQYDGADNPDRPDNLFRALDTDKDMGAHGPFSERAHSRSPLLWLFTRPGHPALGIAAGLGIFAWAVRRIVLSYASARRWC